MAAGIAGVALTTTIGSAGVVGAYYPLRHADVVLKWVLVFVLMAFESAAIHLPSEVILPVGGWLIVKEDELGIGGILAVSAVAALGNTAGSLALYAGGRHGGRPLVRRYGRYFMVTEHDLDRAEQALTKHHVWAVFVTRLIPVIRTYSGFAAGVLRIPVSLFVVLTFLGSLAWCFPFVLLGAQVGENWDVVEGPAKVVGVVILALLLVGLGLLSFRTVRRTA
jgi:membrane protein DedA with SNARE-associated domain